MSHSHADTLPRGTLALAAGLVGFTLVAVTAARVVGMPPVASPVAERAADHVAPVKARTLRFLDTADGGVDIVEASNGALVKRIAPGGETGFIRGVMRGMARDRHMRGLDASAGFALTLWRNGQLSLEDTATGRTLELGAFGADNRRQFAELLS